MLEGPGIRRLGDRTTVGGAGAGVTVRGSPSGGDLSLGQLCPAAAARKQRDGGWRVAAGPCLQRGDVEALAAGCPGAVVPGRAPSEGVQVT